MSTKVPNGLVWAPPTKMEFRDAKTYVPKHRQDKDEDQGFPSLLASLYFVFLNYKVGTVTAPTLSGRCGH